MVEIAPKMAKKKEFLSNSQRAYIFGPDEKMKTRAVSFRLTNEAIELIEEAAKRLNVNKTKALEYIIREFHNRERSPL